MKQCSICFESKPKLDFYQRSSRCKPCHNEYTRDKYQENKEVWSARAAQSMAKAKERNRNWLIGYLRENPCVSCGNNDIEVLEFDHIDRATKYKPITKMICGSLESLKREIDKCRVLCANCHRKHTRRQLGWWTDCI